MGGWEPQTKEAKKRKLDALATERSRRHRTMATERTNKTKELQGTICAIAA